MTKTFVSVLLAAVVLSACSPPASTPPADPSILTNAIRTRAPKIKGTKKVAVWKNEQEKRAAQWLTMLHLDDPEKLARLEKVIATHLTAVRDWHNEQLQIAVAALGTNDTRAVPLDVQLKADATMPRSVHENLMAGLRQDLTPEQVEAILDYYTSRRTEIIMGSYRAIVPDLTAEEDAALLGMLKEAREMAVDYKSGQQIAAIFESGKAKCQEYLIAKGRDWNSLSNAYIQSLEAKKVAAPATNTPAK